MNILMNGLLEEKPSDFIRNNSSFVFEMIPELFICKDFNQNNIWHIFDVFEHILHVLDGVPNNLVLRLAALFHDIGKPQCYKEDKDGVGHFYGHWNISNEIFLKFAEKYKIDERKSDKNQH